MRNHNETSSLVNGLWEKMRSLMSGLLENKYVGGLGLASLVMVIVSSYFDFTSGFASDGKATGWHFILSAILGVSCSVLAAALAVLWDNVIKGAGARRAAGRFQSLFGVPGNHQVPKCYIVAQPRDRLPVDDPQGSVVLLPLELLWWPDLKCAMALQGLVVAVGGQLPEVITPEEALECRNQLDGPAIFFCVGINSNALSVAACASGGLTLQKLFRILQDNAGNCSVKLASVTEAHGYDVDAIGEVTEIPACPVTATAMLVRFQDRERPKVSYVVVGGHYAIGTYRIGPYLRQSWVELADRADSSFPTKGVILREYAIRFHTAGESRAVVERVLVGERLR